MNRLITIATILLLCSLVFGVSTTFLKSEYPNSMTLFSDGHLAIAVKRANTTNHPFGKVGLTSKNGRDVPPSEKEIGDFLSGTDKDAIAALKFTKLRAKLLEKGLPFDPNILLNPDWKDRLRVQHPDFLRLQTSVFKQDGRIDGAVIADTLYLPKQVSVSDDTVILANRMVFEGDDVQIKGPHDIYIFLVEPAVTTTPASKSAMRNYLNMNASTPAFEAEFFSSNKVVDRGTITINADGLGNREWRENKVKRRAKGPFGLNDVNVNDDGTPGRGGDAGIDYFKATRGNDSPNPVDGDSMGDPNGENTPNATGGDSGTWGGDAPDNAVAGEGGHTITYGPIPASDTQNYYFSSHGGTGGPGGRGGQGGAGGDGGDGKRGGNGITSGCIIGNGGKGGDAGAGGDGGVGGRGGDGKKGGDGGTITVKYVIGFDTSHIHTDVRPGDPGSYGPGGTGGGGGLAGSSGTGGVPGPPACGHFGTAGASGATKDGGHAQADGPNGAPGPSTAVLGTVTLTAVQNTPGPTPGGGGGGGNGGGHGYGQLCDDYDWFEYDSDDGGLTWYLVGDVGTPVVGE